MEDLLEKEEVQRIAAMRHHYRTSRLQHSINVAYFSYCLSKGLKLDYVSAARGGLLHDLFYYDFYKENMGPFAHSARHPAEALENARKICRLNQIEEDIIVKHMWLMTWPIPKYPESFLVSFVDKFSAVYEILEGAFLLSKEKLKTRRTNRQEIRPQ